MANAEDPSAAGSPRFPPYNRFKSRAPAAAAAALADAGFDVATLANYCVAVGRAAEAERLISKEGMIYQSKTGPKKHPAVAISSDAQTQARLLAGELGLPPVSASRPADRG